MEHRKVGSNTQNSQITSTVVIIKGREVLLLEYPKHIGIQGLTEPTILYPSLNATFRWTDSSKTSINMILNVKWESSVRCSDRGGLV